MNDGVRWLLAAVSIAAIVAYELRLQHAARRNPSSTARSAHRVMRGEWVQALSRQPGSELLAVQALRNSLMSVTINASTAVLVLMGAISFLISQRNPSSPSPLFAHQGAHLESALQGGLVLTLFAAYVCAAIAMRYYNHAGFVMSLPVGSPERTGREQLAATYVQRAGILYSWSLRCFLYALPLAVGLLNPFSMPIAALVLLTVLTLFDRAPNSPET